MSPKQFDLVYEVPRLLGWKLFEPADLVDGEWRLTGATSRNRNLRLEALRGRGMLVKQADSRVVGSSQSLHREAAFHRLCSEEPAFAAVRPYLPRLLDFIAEECVLIFEWVSGGHPLLQEAVDAGPVDLPLLSLQTVGEALATFHNTSTRAGVSELPFVSKLSSRPPWVLSQHRPQIHRLATLRSSAWRIMKILQGEPGLCGRLDALYDNWRADVLIHGDIKGSNLLVLRETGGARLVDWEFVQRGDPAWDVAGLLQDFVFFWLRGLSLDSNPIAAREKIEPQSMESLQPGLQAFWRGYRSVANDLEGDFLPRAVELSGARLIQTAWESAKTPHLSSAAVRALQVSANILAAPEKALGALYGLDSV